LFSIRTKSVRYENYAFRTREQYMTIIKFEWSPLDRCYDIPPFYINKTNDLCIDYLDNFIINFTDRNYVNIFGVDIDIDGRNALV
jgi:hypothetical protein